MKDLALKALDVVNPPEVSYADARAGIRARKDEVKLVPEERYKATWVSPFRIDP